MTELSYWVYYGFVDLTGIAFFPVLFSEDQDLLAEIFGTINGFGHSAGSVRGLFLYDGSQLLFGANVSGQTRFYSINDLNNPEALLIHTADREYESMSYDPVNNRIYLTGKSGFLGRRTVYVTNAPRLPNRTSAQSYGG